MYIKIYPLVKTEHSNTWTSLCANGYHDNVDFINAITEQITSEDLLQHTSFKSIADLQQRIGDVKHRFHRNILGTPFVTILDLATTDDVM